MTNEEYIKKHRDEDVRSLALKKVPEGVDAHWCLQQIEGWQLARKKLPRWASIDDLWFPPHLSMEQCSSELTAQYKDKVLRGIKGKAINCDQNRHQPADCLIDLTGGFGIDFSYMAQSFEKAIYVEQQPHLCNIARHNFTLLGFQLENKEQEDGEHAPNLLSAANEDPKSKDQQTKVRIVCGKSEDLLAGEFQWHDENLNCNLIVYLDPARRDDIGRKVAALEDCTPNVIDLQDTLLEHAGLVMLKLSPMLDITQALRQLKHVCEVHVVSVKGECKEVLVLQKGKNSLPQTREEATEKREVAGKQKETTEIQEEETGRQGETVRGSITYHCVNLATEDEFFSCTKDSIPSIKLAETLCNGMEEGRTYFLFEPNASVLKAGVQDYMCERYGLMKLHPISNLFVGESPIPNFPGRQFAIEAIGDFSKKGTKEILAGIKQANLTIRNFPSTVADLRKRLKIKEGGNTYLFATTLADGSHAIIRSKKP